MQSFEGGASETISLSLIIGLHLCYFPILFQSYNLVLQKTVKVN
jgi:hypothetical protein